MKKTKKPPLGVVTEKEWARSNPSPSRMDLMKRIADLQRAIAEYKAVKLPVSPEWAVEAQEKIKLIRTQ